MHPLTLVQGGHEEALQWPTPPFHMRTQPSAPEETRMVPMTFQLTLHTCESWPSNNAGWRISNLFPPVLPPGGSFLHRNLSLITSTRATETGHWSPAPGPQKLVADHQHQGHRNWSLITSTRATETGHWSPAPQKLVADHQHPGPHKLVSDHQHLGPQKLVTGKQHQGPQKFVNDHLHHGHRNWSLITSIRATETGHRSPALGPQKLVTDHQHQGSQKPDK